MRPPARPVRVRARALAAALVLGGAAAMAAAAQSTGPRPTVDGARPHIDAVLHHPDVVRRIGAWGLTVADVQHDVDAMSPADRARLAYVLTRRWRSNESHSEADLQAQFLVTVSLMRESTLFASILSTGTSRFR